MILCCGEALIDMLARETAAAEPAFAPHPGGAVFNTALALGRLGAPAGFFGGISTDFLGAMLEERLAHAGVSMDLCIRSARPTTLAFVSLEGGQPRYAFYDEATAGRLVEPGDLPGLGAEVQALFFGGISLVNEPCGSTYEAMMHREATRRVIMLDPNIRPAFISDERAYRGRIERMIAAADIVKLSDEDLGWLDRTAAVADQARAILARGPSLVLVTQGARGAHAFARDQHRFAPARPVKVADTVGAGDTFNAGMLACLWRQGLLRKHALREIGPAAIDAALDLGNRAASVTVSRPGANPPWHGELPR